MYDVDSLKIDAEHAKRALQRAQRRQADAEAHEREARDAADSARVARYAADTVAPAAASLVQADEQLRKLAASD